MAVAVNYIDTNPGVQAFKGQQLDELLVLLLAEKAGYTLPDDLSTLIDETVCQKCLTDTQLKESLVAFLWEQQEDGVQADELMVKIRCLNCVDPKVIKALINHLLVTNLV